MNFNYTQILKKYFDYETLKPTQAEIISEILKGNNVLAILPTGAGKSLCYQVPAIISNSFSIVISPLIALMKDQVDSLNKKEKVATFINSTLSESEIENSLHEINNGIIKILYLAPEKLQNSFFIEKIRNLKPNFLFVDEAHCISQWGHNFRPSYLKIKNFINYCDIKNVSAFTATATEEVRNDIIELLELKNPKIFIKGFERKNLAINVFANIDKKNKLLDILSRNQTPAIIYTSTRKNCEEITSFLKKNNFNASYYHAGVSSEIKKIVQDEFILGKIEIIVATNAFGMGIDKNNIRTIIHYNMPGTIENYYQEIGRAGRDNKDSNIFLLYDNRDKEIQKFFIENSFPSKEQIEIIYDSICDYARIALGFLNDKPIIIDKNLITLFEMKNLNTAIIESALNVLTYSNYIDFQNHFNKDFTVKILLNKNQLLNFLKNESSQEEKDLLALMIKKYSNLIFDKKVKIIIEALSNELQIDKSDLLGLLKKLNNEGIIDLIIPSSFQVINLKQPRVRSKDLILNMNRIEKLYKYQLNKINKIIDFVFTDKCRMNFIINYFGQNDSEYKCLKCDNCKNINQVNNISSEYLEEIILKTIEELKQPIKLKSLIKILRGDFIDNKTNVSTFGSCEHYSTKELNNIIEKLVSLNMLTKHEDFISITEKSINYIIDKDLNNEDSFQLESDIELYNKLKIVRNEASDKFNQSEKMICPDEILLKITQMKPLTYTQLLSIDGFTERMFNKIGEDILYQIKNFIPQNDKLSKTIIDLINNKYTFDEIVSLTKIPESILAIRIESLIDICKNVDFTHLIPQKEIDKIRLKINEGFVDVKDLFQRLDKKISYNKLKIAIKIISTN